MKKIIFIILIFSNLLFAWKMEADSITVNNTSGDNITHIDFRQSYDTPPLVFVLPTDQGSDPATLRVVNVTTSGFDIYIIEPQGEDGPHARMTKVPYIAIEKGEHTLPDGTKILADTIDTKKNYQKNVSNDWESISISGFNTTPVVLAEIQTRNNERSDENVPDAVSKPWFSSIIKDVSSSGFKLTLNRSETSDGDITQNETVAYLVIDSGLNGNEHYFASNSYKKIMFESIRSDKIIKGWGNSSSGYEIDFSQSYNNPIVVANMNTMYGDNGGWLRRREINDDNIKLVVDEDRAKDSERNHIEERAGLLLFSDPFDATFGLESNAKLVINEVLYKETQTGTNNDEFVEFYVKDGGDIKGYILSDQDTNYYVFPSCNVNSGDYVIVYTGSGTNSCSGDVKELYQGKSQYFNNDKDDILLLRPTQDVTTTSQASNPKTFNATPQDYIAYGKSGGAIDAPPTSIKGIKPSWDNSYGNEIDNANSGVSIALTPNSVDSDKSACWEFSASGNASNNGCENYERTIDSDSSLKYTTSKGINNNGAPEMHITKSSIIVSDPVNNTSNPKRVPGAIVRYCFVVDNSGYSQADDVKIKDSLSGDNKDDLDYIKGGALKQSSNDDCDCLSSSMDESKSSINGSDVTIDIGSLNGSKTNTQNARACAFIEVEVK